MKSFSTLSIISIVALIATCAQAQYPDEICHWQCDITYCDYYQDYCDYDCYEVCYRQSQLNAGSLRETLQRQLHVQQPSDTQSQVKTQPRSQVRAQVELVAPVERRGKVVRMRLQNHSPKVARHGPVLSTGPWRFQSAPKGFAVFQDCLAKPDNLSQPLSDRWAPTRSSP